MSHLTRTKDSDARAAERDVGRGVAETIRPAHGGSRDAAAVERDSEFLARVALQAQVAKLTDDRAVLERYPTRGIHERGEDSHMLSAFVICGR